MSHHLEYAKSSRAKCHGPPPCKGSLIGLGDLRYGKSYVNQHHAESIEWRHWGCVTPQILASLAVQGVNHISGFANLRAEDQKKVRMALVTRRIDPADIPESARPGPAPPALNSTTPSSSQNVPASSQVTAPPSSQPSASQGPGPSQKKRKAAFEAAMAAGPGASQAGPSQQQPVRRVQGPGNTTWEEGAMDDAPEEEPVDELYCTMTSSVVGIQYYKGLVDVGEQVLLVREPHNPYDRNAIQVKNIGRVQVGHIPRNIASKLASLLDRKLVTVEGTMNEGNLRGHAYSLSLTLKIYGPSNKRDQLEPMLIWATPGQRGFPKKNTAPPASQGARTARAGASASSASGPSAAQIVGGSSYASTSSTSAYASGSHLTPQQKAIQEAQLRKQQAEFAKAAELRQILNSLEKVDDEARRGSLLDTLCSAEDVMVLPLHPSPPGIESGELTVNLLKHQSQALQWCIDKEYPKLPAKEDDKAVQFWQYRKQNGKVFYYNLATNSPQQTPPVLGRGGLNSDDMGLGKTLTMIALILATKNDVSNDYSKSTLVVVPLSIMSNWEKQLKDHCTPGSISSCVYYGAGRSMTAAELQRHDVVITTYQTVANEVDSASTNAGIDASQKPKRKKVESSLFDVRWKRVVLDEGHNIRNPRTKMAQAVCKLEAERRWVLTGTPIINSPQDLGSIVTFLRICHPLDQAEMYKRLVLRPLKDGDPRGAGVLRSIMSQICIRRTKEMQDKDGNYLVPLPPVEMTLVPVELSPEAREYYDTVEQISRDRLEGALSREREGLNSVSISTHALSMLTRLRQLALHPGLVPADYLDQLRREDDENPEAAIQISPEEKIRLQSVLAQAIEDNEECPICFGILDDPRITSCAHRFCLPCITEVISRDPKCPMDRRPITLGDLIEPPPPTELTQAAPKGDDDEEDFSALRTGSSAKIDQLVHLLKLTPPTEKSLVFSQFTTFLDKIAETLEENGIPYVRFDGQMSARRRQETLERFSVPIEEGSEDAELPTPNASQPRSQSQAKSTTGRSTRRRGGGPAPFPLEDGDGMNDGDDDFVPDDGANDDDDDFVVSDDDTPWGQSKPKKGKGKGKANGKAKTKGKSKARFSGEDSVLTYKSTAVAFGANPKVMLISLKAGALGLNLTVANNVYLMDPWWQEGIESQAIDRCNRIGQKKPVHVYQLIAENTVESKVLDIQEKKKQLIKEAFSGMKNKETQRQKKQARLQDLVQIFGIRNPGAATTQGN